MLRPGGEPEPVVADGGPRFVHHLAWAPDCRILAASDQGELFAIAVGQDSEPWFPEAALVRMRDDPDVPGTATAELRRRVGVPVGLGGDPFAVDADGTIIAVHTLFGDRRGRLLRVSPRGDVTPLAGGAHPLSDGQGEDRLPEEYFPEIEQAHPGVLASQWIPMDTALWKIESFREFLEARKRLLAAEVNRRMEELLHGDTR
jgi:hypothetical protein